MNTIKVENFKYSFSAFLFTFAFYIAKGDVLVGLAILFITGIIPIKDYFLVGLLVGYLAKNSLVPKKNKISFKSILLSCISVLLFSLLKLVRLRLLGSI